MVGLEAGGVGVIMTNVNDTQSHQCPDYVHIPFLHQNHILKPNERDQFYTCFHPDCRMSALVIAMTTAYNNFGSRASSGSD